MMKSHPPKKPSEQYKQDMIWLRAFARAAGYPRKGACKAADEAVAEHVQQNRNRILNKSKSSNTAP